MKISLYLPAGSKNIKPFLEKEIATARNIKSKKTRDSVVSLLSKILHSLDFKELESQGIAYLADESEINILPYPGKDKLYKCGKQFELNPFEYLFEKDKYMLVAMDTNHCTIGLLRGKNITTVWDKEFYIQGKHKSGGQSSQRYERDREEKRKQMFKEVAAKIQEIARTSISFINEKEVKQTFRQLKFKK